MRPRQRSATSHRNRIVPRRPSSCSIQRIDSLIADSRPPLDEVRGEFGLRFAHSERDLEACLRLRFEVFNLELGEGLAESDTTGLDRDAYDEQCNHMMVVEESAARVIGTYRMHTAEMDEAGCGFYSGDEFDLSGIPESIVRKAIELGRACIANEHRSKTVLFLLWRGLMAYLLWNRKRYLFGCSSLTSQDPSEGMRAWSWLEREGHVHPDLVTPTRSAYACEVDPEQGRHGVFDPPKLFRTYLRHGAKITSPPAMDRFFGTIDFLTLLDSQEFDARLSEVFKSGLPRR